MNMTQTDMGAKIGELEERVAQLERAIYEGIFHITPIRRDE